MITASEQVALQMIRKQLLGVQLSNVVYGEAGRDFENKLELIGIPINRKEGIDCIEFNWEVKTRHITATSAQTIGTMNPTDIINTPNYFDTLISKKCKKQLRAVLSENSTILEIDLFDFDDPYIQDKLSMAYDSARDYIIQYPKCVYTPCAKQWAYFENTNPEKTKSLDWRMRDSTMKKLQTMSKDNFRNFFDYI